MVKEVVVDEGDGVGVGVAGAQDFVNAGVLWAVEDAPVDPDQVQITLRLIAVHSEGEGRSPFGHIGFGVDELVALGLHGGALLGEQRVGLHQGGDIPILIQEFPIVVVVLVNSMLLKALAPGLFVEYDPLIIQLIVFLPLPLQCHSDFFHVVFDFWAVNTHNIGRFVGTVVPLVVGFVGCYCNIATITSTRYFVESPGLSRLDDSADENKRKYYCIHNLIDYKFIYFSIFT